VKLRTGDLPNKTRTFNRKKLREGRIKPSMPHHIWTKTGSGAVADRWDDGVPKPLQITGAALCACLVAVATTALYAAMLSCRASLKVCLARRKVWNVARWPGDAQVSCLFTCGAMIHCQTNGPGLRSPSERADTASMKM